jgi:UDP-N-acetylglucosamine 2-epimerase (non-hydrolysing)
MIESLLRTKPKWENSELPPAVDAMLKEKPAVFTFHRPENVDTEECLKRVVEITATISKQYKIIFPIHPRTKSKLVAYNLMQQLEENSNILLTEPMSYFSFLRVINNAAIVITDSGGVQEETSFLNIPCVTFRKNTERPVTVTMGTNILLDIWQKDYFEAIQKHKEAVNTRDAVAIPLWDGEVSARIVDFIEKAV